MQLGNFSRFCGYRGLVALKTLFDDGYFMLARLHFKAVGYSAYFVAVDEYGGTVGVGGALGKQGVDRTGAQLLEVDGKSLLPPGLANSNLLDGEFVAVEFGIDRVSAQGQLAGVRRDPDWICRAIVNPQSGASGPGGYRYSPGIGSRVGNTGSAYPHHDRHKPPSSELNVCRASLKSNIGHRRR